MNNYMGFVKAMDSISTGKKPTNEERIMEMLTHILDIMVDQSDRISDINQRLYEMFPECEIIETMTSDKGERMKMYESYLNLNQDY